MNRRIFSSRVVLLALVASACQRAAEPASPAPIHVGSRAPAFTLASEQGGTVSLADFAGKKPVLLYFSMGPG